LKGKDTTKTTLLQTFKKILEECDKVLSDFGKLEIEESMLLSGIYTHAAMGSDALQAICQRMLDPELPSSPSYRCTPDMSDEQRSQIQSRNTITIETLDTSTRLREYVTYTETRHQIWCSCSEPVTRGLLCAHYFTAFKAGLVPFHIFMLNERWMENIPSSGDVWYCGDSDPTDTIVNFEAPAARSSASNPQTLAIMNENKQKLKDLAKRILDNIDNTRLNETTTHDAILALSTVMNVPINAALSETSFGSLLCSSIFGKPVPKQVDHTKRSSKAPHAMFEQARQVPLHIGSYEVERLSQQNKKLSADKAT
jgi:hypothetical protein